MVGYDYDVEKTGSLVAPFIGTISIERKVPDTDAIGTVVGHHFETEVLMFTYRDGHWVSY